ncbi:hypothetical protein P7F88_17685 [Vibrio hannami]|uniref:hypothetical protein n=1 Tax=Vibrio hannami TaxID=2717094 RepID=UPI00240FD8AF|nr:hypothetical protein [Vibrio hannami]MDG3087799.1 hypothetical protein [Vibrio hannami]
MKLYIAYMCAKEFDIDEKYEEEALGFVIRTESPASCGKLLDNLDLDLPDYIGPFVCLAHEIGEPTYFSTPSNEEKVILGPFKCSFWDAHRCDEDIVIWHRMTPEEVWFNRTRVLTAKGRPIADEDILYQGNTPHD